MVWVKKPELRIRAPVVQHVPLFGQFPIRDTKEFDFRHDQVPMPVRSEWQAVWNSREVLALGPSREESHRDQVAFCDDRLYCFIPVWESARLSIRSLLNACKPPVLSPAQLWTMKSFA
jgi:hypothetical protein